MLSGQLTLTLALALAPLTLSLTLALSLTPTLTRYLTADQSYVNGVFDRYFVPSAASGTLLPSLYYTL